MYILELLDVVGGLAVFAGGGRRYFLSLDGGWVSRELEAESSVLNVLVRSQMQSVGRQFATQSALEQYVRNAWMRHNDLPEVDLDRILRRIGWTASDERARLEETISVRLVRSEAPWSWGPTVPWKPVTPDYTGVAAVVSAGRLTNRRVRTVDVDDIVGDANLWMARQRGPEPGDGEVQRARFLREVRRVAIKAILQRRQQARALKALRAEMLGKASLDVAPDPEARQDMLEALDRLGTVNANAARVARLIAYEGYSRREVAQILGVGRAKMLLYWKTAITWLRQNMFADEVKA